MVLLHKATEFKEGVFCFLHDTIKMYLEIQNVYCKDSGHYVNVSSIFFFQSFTIMSSSVIRSPFHTLTFKVLCANIMVELGLEGNSLLICF